MDVRHEARHEATGRCPARSHGRAGMGCAGQLVLLANLLLVAGPAAARGARRPPAAEKDWRHRPCPSEFSKAGTPVLSGSPLVMGPFSDLIAESGAFCGLPDSLILEVLRHGRVIDAERNGGGLSVSYRLELVWRSIRTWALFKPIQGGSHTLPRAEVAAFRLDRLLGLNRVPPTAARGLSAGRLTRLLSGSPATRLLAATPVVVFRDRSVRGALSWWVPRISFLPWHLPPAKRRWRGWLGVEGSLPAASYDLAGQLSRLLTFDFLLGNQDRLSGGNVVATPDGRRLYFMDNGMALSSVPDGQSRAWRAFRAVERFSRSLLDALERATPRRLRAALRIGSDQAIWFLITEKEFAALCERRRAILTRAAELAIKNGWQETMYFP